MNFSSGKNEPNFSTSMVGSRWLSDEARQTMITLIVVLALGTVLYLVLGATNYTDDDLIEVQAVRDGGSALLPPNHLLSRLLARSIYDIMVSVGYIGNTLLPVRIVVGGSAILGMGMFYLWMLRLVQRRSIAFITTLGFGTSWAYWVFANGMVYIVPAVPYVLGAVVVLWSLYRHADTTKIDANTLIALGLLTALAILFWQTNVFLVPGVLLGLWAKYRTQKLSFAKAAAVYLVIAGTLTLAIYLLASVAVFGPAWSLDSLVSWLSGRGGGAKLASWGVLDISRVTAIGPTWISVFLPVWEGFGLRQLISGEFNSGKILSLLSIPALGLMVVIPILVLIKRRNLASEKRYTALGLVFAALCYMPFIIWWDPTGPADLIIPSIALWGVIGMLWGDIAFTRMIAGALAVLVATLTVANFTAAIWPRHANPNMDLEQADCIAEHLDSNDLYVSNWENYSRYLDYFYNIQIFRIIDATLLLGGPENALDNLADKFETVSEQGGRVFVVDLESYNQEILDWLFAETGIDQSHLESVYGTPAFTCGSVTHYVLNNPPPRIAAQQEQS